MPEPLGEPHQIVRSYSWEVEERLPPGSEAVVLGHVLAEDARREENQVDTWRQYFDPGDTALPTSSNTNPVTDVIAVESSRLREKWLAFRGTGPKAELLDLQAYEPSIDGVVDMVSDMTQSWRKKSSRWQKIAGLFIKFGRTLNSHKALLEVLPQGSEYVSIFTGTLGAIIKVCEMSTLR